MKLPTFSGKNLKEIIELILPLHAEIIQHLTPNSLPIWITYLKKRALRFRKAL